MPRVARDQEGAPMPNRETAPIGAPCWVGLTTADLERSRAFYCQLFGWTAEEPVAELGGYVNFAKDGVRVAGCMASQPGSGALDVWSVYLATDDAEKTLAAATAHGGQVHVPAMAVDDLGIMAFIGDPGGAGIGLWQPGMFPGFGVLGEPGTPSWFELHTRDYAATVGFYRDVFRWQTKVVSDTPEFRYTVLREGEAWLAGVMDATGLLAAGVPAVSYTHLRAHETPEHLVCRLLLEKKKQHTQKHMKQTNRQQKKIKKKKKKK